MIYLSSLDDNGNVTCSCDCPGDLFTVDIQLDWECLWDWDLHLSLPDGSEVYYGNTYEGGFNLNHDGDPCCDDGYGTPPEIITGTANCFGNYMAYSHDYGSGGCCPRYDENGDPTSSWCSATFTGTLTVTNPDGININGTYYANGSTFTIEDGVAFDVEWPTP